MPQLRNIEKLNKYFKQNDKGEYELKSEIKKTLKNFYISDTYEFLMMFLEDEEEKMMQTVRDYSRKAMLLNEGQISNLLLIHSAKADAIRSIKNILESWKSQDDKQEDENARGKKEKNPSRR